MQEEYKNSLSLLIVRALITWMKILDTEVLPLALQFWMSGLADSYKKEKNDYLQKNSGKLIQNVQIYNWKVEKCNKKGLF